MISIFIFKEKTRERTTEKAKHTVIYFWERSSCVCASERAVRKRANVPREHRSVWEARANGKRVFYSSV